MEEEDKDKEPLGTLTAKAQEAKDTAEDGGCHGGLGRGEGGHGGQGPSQFAQLGAGLRLVH